MLYMKAKQLKKAMRLAQKAKLSEYVKKINQELAIAEQEEANRVALQ